MDQELIKSWDEMEDHMVGDKVWEAYIFCKKHIVHGVEALSTYGVNGIRGQISDPKLQKKARIEK